MKRRRTDADADNATVSSEAPPSSLSSPPAAQGRRRRAAALTAELLTHLHHQDVKQLRRAQGEVEESDEDEEDKDYKAQISQHKQQKQQTSTASPLSAVAVSDLDIWAEDERDPRHQQTRTTGCYLVTPIYSVPPGYIDYNTALKQQQQQEEPTQTAAQNRQTRRSKKQQHATAVDVPLSFSSSVQRPPVPAAPVLLPSGLTSASPDESLQSLTHRSTALQHSLQALQQQFSSLLAQTHQQVFDAITLFVTEKCNEKQRLQQQYRPAIPIPIPPLSISYTPTALLYAGLTMADHPAFLQQLEQHLQQPSTPDSSSGSAVMASSSSSVYRPRCYSIILQSGHCHKTEPALMHLLTAFLSQYPTSSTHTSLSLRSRTSLSSPVVEQHFLSSIQEQQKREARWKKDVVGCFLQWYKDVKKEEQQRYHRWSRKQRHEEEEQQEEEEPANTEDETQSAGQPALDQEDQKEEHDGADGEDVDDSNVMDSYNHSVQPSSSSSSSAAAAETVSSSSVSVAIPPLVLIVDQLHTFDGSALSQLLYILMSHPVLSPLPWCFLFGLALDIHPLHDKLTQTVLMRLALQKFYLPHSLSCLTPVLYALPLASHSLAVHQAPTAASLPIRTLAAASSSSPAATSAHALSLSFSLPFLLPPETLSWLLQDYLSEHTSLSAWSHVLTVLLIEYYATVLGSHLVYALHTHDAALFSQSIQQLTPADIHSLRQLPSIQARLSTHTDEDNDDDDATFRTQLTRWMCEFHAYKAVFCQAFHLLKTVAHIVGGILSADDLNHRHDNDDERQHNSIEHPVYQRVQLFLSLYTHLYQTTSLHTTSSSSSSSAPAAVSVESWPVFDQLVTGLRALSSEVKIMNVVNECITLLQQSSELQEHLPALYALKDRFHKLQENAKENSNSSAPTSAASSSTAAASTSATPAATSTTNKPVRTRTLKQRREALDAVLHTRSDVFRPIKEGVISWFTDFCLQHLRPFTAFPTHELFLFHDSPRVHTWFDLQSQAALHTAFTRPEYYTQQTDPLHRHPSVAELYVQDIESSDVDVMTRPMLCADMADMSIVYRLYEESDRIIDVYDWFVAFVAVKSGPTTTGNANDNKSQQKKKNMKQEKKETDSSPRKRGMSVLMMQDDEDEEEQEQEEEAEEEQTAEGGVDEASESKEEKDAPDDDEEEDPVSVLTPRQQKDYCARFLLCLSALQICGYIKPAVKNPEQSTNSNANWTKHKRMLKLVFNEV